MTDKGANDKVLVIAAHPDDEILGCGGTIARHAAEGDDVHIFILSTGVVGRYPVEEVEKHRDEIDALRAAAEKAAEILGARPPVFGPLPDNRFASVDFDDVVQTMEGMVADVRPSIIYTHFEHDLNLDHNITYRAVITACRPVPEASVSAIYSFETVSSTEWRRGGPDMTFHPSLFVDIAPYLEAKIEALQAYGSEMRTFPHPRSIENIQAMARSRGSAVGVEAAEAFAVISEIRRTRVLDRFP